MIDQKVKPIRALERGLDVLREIQSAGALSLGELHVRLGLPKATLLRVLVTLAGRGLVWRRLADGAYLPSVRGGDGRLEDIAGRLAQIASEQLVGLSDRTHWPSVIAVPRLDHMQVIETNGPVARFDSLVLGPVGARLSYVHTATGRAYLAACGAEEREAIIARLEPAGGDPAGRSLLEAILAETRRRGFSTREPHHPWPDRNRHTVLRDGKASIAVPVMAGGVVVAAINLTWPARRATVDEVAGRHLDALRAVAARVGMDAGRSV